MSDFEMNTSGGQGDLLERIKLMEAMIAEGRRSTWRHGWIFVLWGLVSLVAIVWQPYSYRSGIWAWPVCLVAGAVITIVGKAMQARGEGRSRSMQCRNVEAVWGTMGAALAIFVAFAMVRHLTWQLSYIAALLMIVGMAHAISALILRWRVQGVVAAIWWLGGVATFFAPSTRVVTGIMFVEMCLCMILFGLYAMLLERRTGGGRVINA